LGDLITLLSGLRAGVGRGVVVGGMGVELADGCVVAMGSEGGWVTVARGCGLLWQAVKLVMSTVSAAKMLVLKLPDT